MLEANSFKHWKAHLIWITASTANIILISLNTTGFNTDDNYSSFLNTALNTAMACAETGSWKVKSFLIIIFFLNGD